MSLEFIEFLRKQPVYKNFDGEVVSCEEHVVKPDAKIYDILTSRYSLTPSETLFIDDRKENVEAAIAAGSFKSMTDGLGLLGFPNQKPILSLWGRNTESRTLTSRKLRPQGELS